MTIGTKMTRSLKIKEPKYNLWKLKNQIENKTKI